jgi:methylenetetrahydrofolate reductase (NADPH)
LAEHPTSALTLRRWSVRHAGALERVYRAFLQLRPVLRRAVRGLGAARAARWTLPFERRLKGLFFGCRMCGQCALSTSGMSCPMNCPKGHRNGPCGGVWADGSCEVDRAMRCVWIDALEGARRMSANELTAGVEPPLDGRREGASTWVRAVLENEMAEAAPAPCSAAPRGNAGALERACRSGRFVVTAELAPSDSADAEDVLRRAERLRGLVDALNVTDGAGAHCHMSSLAASALLAREGHHPVFQIACRDRNRIAMQADILGAAALGISNLLCITGDHVASGDHPDARPVFDVDSVALLGIARAMRDRGTYASGRALATRPALFLGATANPFAPPYQDRIANLRRKIAAGAQFIETQYCFDPPLLEAFLGRVRAAGLEGRASFIVGVGPLVSLRAAHWMLERVPGVHIPREILARLERAADPVREGVRICVEIIEAVRGMRGVAGVHLMAHRREDLAAEIIERAGLRSAAAVATA